MRAKVLPLGLGAPASLRSECERAAVVELRAYRRTRNLTAEGLAHELGCSPDSAERWLTGKIRVPGWVVIAIRRATDDRRAA